MSQYYLGDPCYVIPDAEWDDFCQISGIMMVKILTSKEKPAESLEEVEMVILEQFLLAMQGLLV